MQGCLISNWCARNQIQQEGNEDSSGQSYSCCDHSERATSLLQPLDVGIYGPYKEYLKTHLHGSKAVNVINASEAVFHDAFSYDNIVHAWDKTMLTDDHSSILDQLPKENPVRRNVHSSRISGKVLF